MNGRFAIATVVALLVMCVLFWLTATKARAQTCDDYRKITEHLEQKYHEKPALTGVTDGNGYRMEMFVSHEGTWTVVVMNPNNGVACFILSGEGWSLVPQGNPS